MYTNKASIELLSISFETVVIVVSQIVVIVSSTTTTVHTSSIQTVLKLVIIFIILHCINVVELFVVEFTYLQVII